MVTGARFLGGYIRDDESKCDWLKERTEKLKRDICGIRKTTNDYPQESYDVVACAVQSERIFL